jgi:prepilin-type N-terminal cleavage/methylation domain-containing protein
MITRICQVRDGFTLVEVLVSMLVLTVGILGVAATTGHIFSRLNDAGRRTERVFAVQQMIEEVRTVPFTKVSSTLATTPPIVVGAFTISAQVREETTQVIRVQIEAKGPGYRPGVGRVYELTDTTYITISKGGT